MNKKWRYRLPAYVASVCFLGFVSIMGYLIHTDPPITHCVILRVWAMGFFIMTYVAGFTFVFDTARLGVREWEKLTELE